MDPPSLNEEVKGETKVLCLECIFNNFAEFFLYVSKKNHQQSNEELRPQNENNNRINIDPLSSDTDRNLSFIFRDVSNTNKIQASDIWKKVGKRGIEIYNESEVETIETIFQKFGVVYVKKILLEFVEGIKSMKQNNKIKIGLITFSSIMNLLIMVGLLQTIAVSPFALNLAFSIFVLFILAFVILVHILEIILLIKKTIITSFSLKFLFLFLFFVNEVTCIVYLILVKDVSSQTFSYSLILFVGYNIIWIIYFLIICLISVILIGLQIILFVLYLFFFLPYLCCCSHNESTKVGTSPLPEQSSQLCPICFNMLETIDQKVAKINCISQHQFHEKCIGLWLLKSSNCPLDRSIVTKATI